MNIFWKIALPLMDNQKVKPADLARLTGKNKSSVSDWINKEILPKADDAVKIADKLGVSVRYLVTGEKDEIPPMSEQVKSLLPILVSLPEEDLESVRDFIAIIKKNEWRKKGGISVHADGDA